MIMATNTTLDYNQITTLSEEQKRKNKHSNKEIQQLLQQFYAFTYSRR